MTRKRLDSFILAIIFTATLALPSFAAALSSATLKKDIDYYHRVTREKKLSANDRAYILRRIKEKYTGTNVNLSPLTAEMNRLSGTAAATDDAESVEAAAEPREQAAEPAADAGTVTRVLVSETSTESRIIITASGVTRMNHFILRDPEPRALPKIVVDLSGVKAQLSAAAKNIRPRKGLFAQVRAAQFEDEPPIVRIVAQVRENKPYRITQSGGKYILSVSKESVPAAPVEAAPAAAPVETAVAASSPTTTVAVEKTVEQRAPAIETKAPESKPPSSTKPSPALSNYTIEAGDVLSIAVYPSEELSREIIVQQDGSIAFPLIGTAKARGLTPKTLEDNLTRSLGKYIANPQVSVTVKQFSRRQIFVTGEVRSVGAYAFKENMRLLEFISSAGGFTDEANRAEVKIYRGPSDKRVTHVVNVGEIIKSGDFSKDFLLEPGDIIEVPRGRLRVAILGDVRSPGYYDYRDNLALLELISQAGGFSETAQINKVSILRPDPQKGQVVTKVDLKKILSGDAPDIKVQSGDTVYLPKKTIASANWFINNILPWLSLLSIVLIIQRG